MKKRVIVFLIVIMALLVAVCFTACTGDKEGVKAPENLWHEERTVAWDKVENATEYIVYAGGKEFKTTDNYLRLWTLPKGEYKIEVAAANENSISERSVINVNFDSPTKSGQDELGFLYTLLEDGSGYEVSCGVADLNGTVTIPDYFCNLPVKRIAEKAFVYPGSYPLYFEERDCNKVTTNINLPKYLESIGKFAFSCMVRLQEIVVPEGVTIIEDRAFEGDTHLKKVTLPKSLKEVGKYAFNNTPLVELILPEGLEIIRSGAFACIAEKGFADVILGEEGKWVKSELSSIVIPKSVRIIEGAAFFNRKKLSNITFSPEKLEVFGFNVFYNTLWASSQADGLATFGSLLYGYMGEMPENYSLTIPSDIKYIAGQAFYKQKNLKKLVIPNGVKLIGDQIFSGCSGLTEVILPSDLEEIPMFSFSACKELKSIIIPASLKKLGLNPFENTQNIFYEGNLEQWTALKAQNNDENMLGTIYTYSEAVPTEVGNYWHYVDGVATPYQ